MMKEKGQQLSVKEQESIAEMLLRLVASYDGFPKTIDETKIHIDCMENNENIGIFPTSGAVVLKKYVSGSFEAQFPFEIDYKCMPTNNAAFLSKRKVLDDLAAWLETTEYPDLADGGHIDSISRASTSALVGKTKEGSSVFRCRFVLKYFKKRGK